VETLVELIGAAKSREAVRERVRGAFTLGERAEAMPPLVLGRTG
jgi:hypothetical protein